MAESGFWQGRSVLVTGGTGFLGGWLVRDLVGRGAEVIALIRDGAPRSMLVQEGWIERVQTVRGDVQDPALLRRTLCEYGVETVFHLAAQTLVGVARRDPAGTLEANVRGTWMMLEAARRAQSTQVVVASSDKAYGSSEHLPYVETDPLQGEFPYDVSKSCADLICRMYARTYDLPVALTRCGNLYGGGDLNFSRTVPGVIRSTLLGERFVIRSDGHYVRDYLYVKDAVEGYLLLGERLASDPTLAGEAFNLGHGAGLTVLEITHKVLELLDRTDLEPVIQNVATGEIRAQFMSAEKARLRLGWAPRNDVEAGLEETIDWYRRFLALPSTRPEAVRR